MEMEKKLDDEKKEKCSAENLNDFKKLQQIALTLKSILSLQRSNYLTLKNFLNRPKQSTQYYFKLIKLKINALFKGYFQQQYNSKRFQPLIHLLF